MADNHFEDDRAKVLSAIKTAQQRNSQQQADLIQDANEVIQPELITASLLGEILRYTRSVLEMRDLGAHFLSQVEGDF